MWDKDDLLNEYYKLEKIKDDEDIFIGVITGGNDFQKHYNGIMEIMLNHLANEKLFFFIPDENVKSKPTYDEIKWEGIFETYLYYLSDESVEFFKNKQLPIYRKLKENGYVSLLNMWVSSKEINDEIISNNSTDLYQYLYDNPIPLQKMKIYYYMKPDENNNLLPRELLTDHYLPYLPCLPYLEKNKYGGECKNIIENFSNAVVNYDIKFQWQNETFPVRLCEPGGPGMPNFDRVANNIASDPKAVTALDLGYGILFDFVAKYAYKPVNVTKIDYDAATFLQIIEQSKKSMKEINGLHFEVTNFFDQYKEATEYTDKIMKEAEKIRKRGWPNCNNEEVDCDINPNFSEDLSKIRDMAKKSLELKKTLKK